MDTHTKALIVIGACSVGMVALAALVAWWAHPSSGTRACPIVQRTVNNGCSFESCGERWEGQRWHGWNLCPTHYAETAQRTEVAVMM
jgi:hypothetical protein